MEWSVIFQLAAVLINLLVLAVGGTWVLARMEARQKDALAEHRQQMNNTVAEVRQQAFEQAERTRRDFGETIAAMQTKIHEFETWTRDTFVRRDSFMVVIQETKALIQVNGEKIDKRLDKIEEKIDGLQASR